MFGTEKGVNLDGLSIPSLQPGIYSGVQLMSVKKEKTKKGDGTEGKTILTFLFKVVATGLMHQHTEYDILDTDKNAADKRKRMGTNIGHIMSKFVPKEQIEGVQHETFDAYADWVVATLTPAIAGVTDLDLKVVGNYYDGKATTQLPMFPPFIARKSQAGYKELSMTAYDNQQNAAYFNSFNAKPDTESTDTTTNKSASGAPLDADF